MRLDLTLNIFGECASDYLNINTVHEGRKKEYRIDINNINGTRARETVSRCRGADFLLECVRKVATPLSVVRSINHSEVELTINVRVFLFSFSLPFLSPCPRLTVISCKPKHSSSKSNVDSQRNDQQINIIRRFSAMTKKK